MRMCPEILNTLGLVLNMAGVALVFIYANPQPLFEEGVGGIGLEDATPVPGHGGKTVKQLRDEARELRQRYALWSRFGLLLLALGFLLQLIAVWVASLLE
jgi:hypothetical protein